MILRGTAYESVLVTAARRLYARCARAEHHDRGRGCGQFGRLGGRGKGYGDNAEVESARRVDELAEAGDYDGEGCLAADHRCSRPAREHNTSGAGTLMLAISKIRRPKLSAWAFRPNPWSSLLASLRAECGLLGRRFFLLFP